MAAVFAKVKQFSQTAIMNQSIKKNKHFWSRRIETERICLSEFEVRYFGLGFASSFLTQCHLQYLSFNTFFKTTYLCYQVFSKPNWTTTKMNHIYSTKPLFSILLVIKIRSSSKSDLGFFPCQKMLHCALFWPTSIGWSYTECYVLSCRRWNRWKILQKCSDLHNDKKSVNTIKDDGGIFFPHSITESVTWKKVKRWQCRRIFAHTGQVPTCPVWM